MARQAIAAAKDDPEVLRAAGFALAALAGENETALDRARPRHRTQPQFALALGTARQFWPGSTGPTRRSRLPSRAIRLSPQHPTYMHFMSRWATPTWPLAAMRRHCCGPTVRFGKMPVSRAAHQAEPVGHLGRHEEAGKCLRTARNISRTDGRRRDAPQVERPLPRTYRLYGGGPAQGRPTGGVTPAHSAFVRRGGTWVGFHTVCLISAHG